MINQEIGYLADALLLEIGSYIDDNGINLEIVDGVIENARSARERARTDTKLVSTTALMNSGIMIRAAVTYPGGTGRESLARARLVADAFVFAQSLALTFSK